MNHVYEYKITNLMNNDDKLKTTVQALDQKIIIKEKKEKGKNKTYVSGLTAIDNDTNTKVGAEKLGKTLKTKFGCGCHVVEEDKSFCLVFQGYHRDKIANYLKEKYPQIKISN
jgi:translation initiation factor 1 (eIF-1/SUI1)